jgi:hypothetical protein
MYSIPDILKKCGFPEDFVVIDFESYFDSEYTLRTLQPWEYITDPRFECLGCGFFYNLANSVRVKEYIWPDRLADNFRSMQQRYGEHLEDITVVVQNAQFDLVLLKQVYGITAKFTIDVKHLACHQDSKSSHRLADLAKRCGLQEKGRTDDFKGLHLWQMSNEQRNNLAEYCKNDCDLEAKVFEHLLPRLSWPEMELWIAHHTTGLYLNPKIMFNKPLADELRAKMTVELQNIVDRTGFPLKKISGNKSIIDLFLKVLPPDEALPLKQGKSALIPALAKNDDGCNYLLAHPDEKVANLMEARLAVKSWPNHLKRIDKMESLSNAAGALPVPLNYYGSHCVTPGHEVLTENGWVPIEHWNGGQIMQFDPHDDSLSFLPATAYRSKLTGEDIYSVASSYFAGEFTSGHKFLRRSKHIPYTHIQASILAETGRAVIPISGMHLFRGTLGGDKLRLVAAIQADGHWQLNTKFGRELRFGLTKERKQIRIRELFKANGITFREGKFRSHPGEITFRVAWKDVPPWLKPEYKLFGPWLLTDASTEGIDSLLDEVQFWDGYKNKYQVEYYSNIRENLRWVATLCHLRGKAAKPRMHDLVIRETGSVDSYSKKWSSYFYSGPIYCPETQTGYWLCRFRDTIYVTGNTGRSSGGGKINLCNLGGSGRAGAENHPLIKAMRGLLVAPPGYVLALDDSAQIECRFLAWVAGCKKLVTGFSNKEDVYSVFATELFGEEVRKPKKGDFPTVYQRMEIMRGFGKDAILGCGYGMGADKFHTRCLENKMLRPLFDSKQYDFLLIKKLINTYRRTYVEIPAFWGRLEKMFRWVVKYPHEHVRYGIKEGFKHDLLQMWNDRGTVNVRLPSGRILFYPHASISKDGYDLRYEHGKLWGGTLTENIVQAACRDLLMVWLRECEEHGRPIVHHVYDELISLVPVETCEADLSYITSVMERAPSWAEGCPLGAEGKISLCYTK